MLPLILISLLYITCTLISEAGEVRPDDCKDDPWF